MKKNLKKVLAAGLAASMVMGTGLVALAANQAVDGTADPAEANEGIRVIKTYDVKGDEASHDTFDFEFEFVKYIDGEENEITDTANLVIPEIPEVQLNTAVDIENVTVDTKLTTGEYVLERYIEIDNIDELIESIENVNNDVLKDIIDKVSAELGKCVVFFANVINNEKIIFVAKSKENAANCGMLVKNAAIITGGNGGGRPDFAQAGGKDVTKVDEALQMVKDSIK